LLRNFQHFGSNSRVLQRNLKLIGSSNQGTHRRHHVEEDNLPEMPLLLVCEPLKIDDTHLLRDGAFSRLTGAKK